MESQSVTPETAKEKCAICFSDLNVKHSVILQPCHHKFHASCTREWMEKQEERRGQTCPMCRALTVAVIDEEGESSPPGFPYGETGQPTLRVLIREAQPANIMQLLQETMTRLARYEELDRAEKEGVEYKADIKEEKKQMMTRLETLQRIKSEIDRRERQIEMDEELAWSQQMMQQLRNHQPRFQQFQMGLYVRQIEGERELRDREHVLTWQLRDAQMVFEHYAVDSMAPYDVNRDAREYVEWRQLIERAVSRARVLEQQLVEVRNRLREMREEDARGDAQPAQPDPEREGADEEREGADEERESADADEDDTPNLQGLSIGGDMQEQQ